MKRSISQLIPYIAIVAVSLAVPAVLRAHAKLEKTLPVDRATVSTVPQTIQLWFDEAVDGKVSQIALAGPSSKVAVGPTKTMGPKSLVANITGTMPDATYTVTWQTAAADDGHVSKGTFTFTVKKAH